MFIFCSTALQAPSVAAIAMREVSQAPEAGIAATLATERAGRISRLAYELHFDIPAPVSDRIHARETVRFALSDRSLDLSLDFAPGADRVASITANGQAVAVNAVNGHLVLPSAVLASDNAVDIVFDAGDASLNRNPAFLYSVFVPARASLAFPCFDQPDLKARFSLSLDLPASWQAVANGAEASSTASGDRRSIRFVETQPLSTYLFAFAAGDFRIETAERAGRTFRMFHRETDAAKVARNRDAIFDLHSAALTWLERYTGMPYAFGKFDFVLIPSFQFGGMEHAGAILYNATALLLDESATQNQKLGRASVIAHETAHMWFGNLVTMKWFDDVWMKEVFANFMAAKIVNPSFPEINHELRFLLSHYPDAYEVDRTEGANPIRQRLLNLSEAGSLYGAIIYEKAPIVMRQLETILGEEPFRDGLRDYLRQHAFANASWTDLIRLLDGRTDRDLAAWSHAWVEEPARPTIATDLTLDTTGHVSRLAFSQTDPRQRSLVWTERLHVLLGYPEGPQSFDLDLDQPTVVVSQASGLKAPLFVLPTGGGVGYGLFKLDPASLAYLLAHLPDLTDPLTRGSAWVTLWDAMLERQITPAALLDLGLRALPRETDELNVERVLTYMTDAYWRYLNPTDRLALAPRLEGVLTDRLARSGSMSMKSTYFSAFRNDVLTHDGMQRLERVWRKSETIAGLTFAENDYTSMALALAVREVPAWSSILDEQLVRIENPDRKARFAFVMPALSSDPAVRDRFFASLANVENRRHEPWALDGVSYLNHPLRSAHAARYVRPSLDLLREIQRTGDIFFPKRWVDAALSGHQSKEVAQTVREFLATQQAYPERLRQIVLQSSDELFRASAIQ